MFNFNYYLCVRLFFGIAFPQNGGGNMMVVDFVAMGFGKFIKFFLQSDNSNQPESKTKGR